VLATPNLKEGAVSVIDMKTWKVIKRIDTSARDSSCVRTRARATPGPTT